MKVRELEEILTDMDTENEVVFYLLKDYNLDALQLESTRDSDGQCEITVKGFDTDEGGNR
jgi:hypothetical protein